MIDVSPVQALGERVTEASSHALVGAQRELRACLVCVLAGGHGLLEGPPGVAKTLLVRTLATTLGGSYGRVQFTPDLMPADVTGTSVFRPSSGEFEFRSGPIFAQVLLADEINRAPAKTQSSLLEAMQEAAVTVDGQRHELPRPFVVFATQNPVEHEGTYPLPEAQLDRFLFKIRVRYPEPEVEERLLREAAGRPLEATPEQLGVRAVTGPEELTELRELVRSVVVRDDLYAYVVRLIGATRGDGALSLGASPRAGVMMIAAARALAALSGRDFVTPDDLKSVVPPALRHRIVLDPAEELAGTTPDAVLQRLLDSVEVPR
jgi:MoxR-like ATPase